MAELILKRQRCKYSFVTFFMMSYSKHHFMSIMMFWTQIFSSLVELLFFPALPIVIGTYFIIHNITQIPSFMFCFL